jgi:hypothetical protein
MASRGNRTRRQTDAFDSDYCVSRIDACIDIPSIIDRMNRRLVELGLKVKSKG